MEYRPFILSGGGLRGIAHAGVIQALQEYGIQPSAISGTSAGAVIGAFLANGFTPEEICDMIESEVGLKLVAWNSFKSGLVSMSKIRQFLEKNLRTKSFDALQFPLFIAATDFRDGRQKIFDRGNLVDAIMASSAIPALFPPVFIDGIPYVDGGLYNNLPVEPLVSQITEAVTVYVNPFKPFVADENILAVLDRALHLMFRPMVNRSARDCFCFIEPSGLTEYGLFEVRQLRAMYDCGYRYARDFMEQMKHTGRAPHPPDLW